VKIAFLVNNLKTESPTYTTIRLAMTARGMEHEVWMLSTSDFVYDPSGEILAHARTTPKGKNGYRSLKTFLADIQSDKARRERVSLDDIDVLMLRNDPSEDAGESPWAQTSGILFGQLAAARGVIVVNDPAHLANALDKTYFQQFPEEVRPRTSISRDPAEIKRFVEEQKGTAVIKPLQGSGGHSVFLVRPDDKPNLNQMIEAVTRDGYVMVQEYLPAAAEGDVRMFVMNGEPLRCGGKIAAFRRHNSKGDMRSNMHVGGVAKKVAIDDNALRLAEMVRPKLIQDGMFLVGLDIVKDKLMEINVFSPGGLGSAEQCTGVNFTETVIEALERKVRYKAYYGHTVDNVRLATI
jgi:glutathione synthase